MAHSSATDRRRVFRALHEAGTFIMPNPWDVGSARLLQHAGFPALATTSAGLAWSLGIADQQVDRDRLVAHVQALSSAVSVPLSVDSERCFPDAPGGIATTIERLRQAGAAGCSIEDYDPVGRCIESIDVASQRVAEAAEAAHGDDADGLVLTARCENHLYGIGDLDDTIARLRSYAAAGADCVYAPGLSTIAQIRAVVTSVAVPVNVLAWPSGPSVADIAAAGARRVSVGGALAGAAYGALMTGARELLEHGTTSFRKGGLNAADRAAFD